MKVSKKGGGDNGFTPRVVEIVVETQVELDALFAADCSVDIETLERVVHTNEAVIIVSLLENIYEEAK